MAKLTENEQINQVNYLSRYDIDPREVSKNHASTFYNLFSLDFDNQETIIPHIDCINSTRSFGRVGGKLKFLPEKIQNILNLKNKKVLDFGCGLGQFVHDAVNKFEATKAYGIDIASVEKGLTSQLETEKCVFMTGGATNIDLEDNSVDIITGFLSLEHVFECDVDALLAEFNRVCKGGYLFQISHHPGDSKNMRKTCHDFSWWYSKLKTYVDDAYLYHFPKDNYKWNLPPHSGLTRWICSIKD